MDIYDKGMFFVVCDDSGEIKVIDVVLGRLFKLLYNKYDNICLIV